MAYPLIVNLRPSRILLGWGALIHGVILTVLMTSSTTLAIKVSLGLFVGGSLLRFLYVAFHKRQRCAFESIQCGSDKFWKLISDDGDVQSAEFTGSYATPILIILYLRLLGSKRRCTVLVFRDAVDGRAFKTLLAALKMGMCRPGSAEP